MPPRFSYWTIIAGGLPTAFRASEREELLPTFTRLKEKQPDAEMKWFARGKLWSSPEEARGHSDRRREERPGASPRDDRDRQPRGEQRERQRDAPREKRGRDWRPGGDHRDPRQQFKDAKKARNQRFKAEKFARKPRRDDVPRERPHGDHLVPDRPARPDLARHGSAPSSRKPWTPEGRKAGDRDRRSDMRGSDRGERRPEARGRDGERRLDRQTENRQDQRWKPTPRGKDAYASRGDWTARPPREKPHGDKVTRPPHARDRDRPWQKPRENAGGSWSQKPRGAGHGTSRGGSRGDTSWKPQPSRDERTTDSRPRGDWNARPPREKPHGDKLTRPPQARDRDRPWQKSRDDASRSWSQKPRGEGHGTYRGEGHGDNSWKPRPPRDDRTGAAGAARPFAPRGFDRERARGSSGTEEAVPPPRPRGPNREPRPSEEPKPSAPPRPSEPIIPPPGPPERGRLNRNKRIR